ncbi:MAG: CoA-binding protein [Halobacteriota archaeon]|nr:CoA-binding protein [Halobacteriota archaeon]
MNKEIKDDLNLFFDPKSIAVIGSFGTAWFGGKAVIRNLKTFGYSGEIFPVNPSYKKISGMKVYPSVVDVSGDVDLAVVMTSASVVPEIIKECTEKDIRAAVVVADGFGEIGDEGKKLQKEMLDAARKNGLRIIGPNTIGTVNTKTGLVTNPYDIGYGNIRKGSVAISGQTGLVGAQALPLEDLGYGISKICDFGNKCDVDEADLLEYLVDDEDTKVIAMHSEIIRDGSRFLRISREVSKKKPLLIFKSGRTKESAKALESHTGSLAGEDRIYDGAFKQAGIIRVKTFNELFDLAKAFSYHPLPSGNRMAIITMTGGAGIIAIDTASDCGLVPAKLSEETSETLSKIYHTLGKNPIDLGPAVPVASNLMMLYKDMVEAVLSDQNVDCILVTLYGSAMIPGKMFSSMFKKLEFTKPTVIWIYGTNLSSIEETSRHLENLSIPVFSDLETAVRALGAMLEYNRWKHKDI